MKKEINIFLTALMFFTRIPVTANLGYSEDNHNQSTKYLPLIGWLVGGIAALLFYGCHLILPQSVAVIISMIGTILLTGAFHEDGFADLCDGIGGGWTKERILEIMKDSRVGAYGVIGICLMLLLKFVSLNEMKAASLPFILLTGHTISRLVPVVTVTFFSYAREDATSKSKPVAKQLPKRSFLLATLLAFIPFMLLNPLYLLPILGVIIASAYLIRLLYKNLGGYTGDCLGALQQLSEVAFYIGCLIIQTKVL